MPLRFRLFFFPILDQSSATPEAPCKGAFDNPTPRQYLEAICRVRTLYDLDSPAPDVDQRIAQIKAWAADRDEYQGDQRPHSSKSDTHSQNDGFLPSYRFSQNHPT